MKKGKLGRIREKVHNFFSTVSITGISCILSSKIILLRIFWTVLILGSFSFGLFNILESVKDFYNYDVITNVETVTPTSVILPAIAFCSSDVFTKCQYSNNGTIISRKYVKNSRLSMKDFLISFQLEPIYGGVKPFDPKELEFFKIPDLYSQNRHGLCFRINGALNKKRATISYNTTSDHLILLLRKSTIPEYLDEGTFNIYSLDKSFMIFIGNNHINSYSLNSFSDSSPLKFYGNSWKYEIEIEKLTIEEKLGEPYGKCRKMLGDETYRQMNCIEECLYRNIGQKFKCTFSGSLFTIVGLEECKRDFSFWSFKSEHYNDCEMKCPRECDSTKFSKIYTYTDKNSDHMQLWFWMPDFSSVKITQIPKMNGFHLIANIGASIGFFMGSSLLNSVDVLNLIIDLFSIVFE